MDDDVGVASDRAGEVRVQRDVERKVLVLCDVERARAEVLGSMHRLGCKELQDEGDVGLILQGVERLHKRAPGRDIDLEAKLLRARLEAGLCKL